MNDDYDGTILLHHREVKMEEVSQSMALRNLYLLFLCGENQPLYIFKHHYFSITISKGSPICGVAVADLVLKPFLINHTLYSALCKASGIAILKRPVLSLITDSVSTWM